jgi:putative transposase
MKTHELIVSTDSKGIVMKPMTEKPKKQYTSYKYRIYPSEDQKYVIAKHAGTLRFVYNKTLEKLISNYKNGGKFPSYFDMNRAWKRTCDNLKEDMLWLNEPLVQSRQQVLQHLHRAYTDFFKGVKTGKGKGFPKFKKRKSSLSIHYTQGVILRNEGKVKVPKIGEVKIVYDLRDIDFDQGWKQKKSILTKNSSNQYFLSTVFELDQPYPETSYKGNIIGLDFGSRSLITTATATKGKKIRGLNKKFKKEKEKLKRLQRKLAKKIKGSKNYEKARIKIARVHQYISNIRTNLLHKITSKIVNDNQVIIIEDLSIRNMVKNHKLAETISMASWSRLVTMLEYKCLEQGKALVKVDRWFPSSKLCYCCKTKNTRLGSEEKWTCDSCNTSHDRDINAARNIRAEGIRILKEQGLLA